MKKTMLMMSAAMMMALVPAAAHADHHEGMKKDGHHEKHSPEEKAEWMAKKHMKKIDTNSDGTITKQEMDEYSAMKFSKADADSDGVITMDELEAAKMAEMKEWKAKHKMKKGEEHKKDHGETMESE